MALASALVVRLYGSRRGYQHQTSFLFESKVFLYHTVLVLVAAIDDVIETPDQVFSGVDGC